MIEATVKIAAIALFAVVSACTPTASVCTSSGDCPLELSCVAGTCIAASPGEGEGDAGEGEGDVAEGEGDAAEGEGDAAEGEGDAAEGEGDAAEGEGEGDAAEGEGDAGEGEGDAAEGEGDAGEGEGEGEVHTLVIPYAPGTTASFAIPFAGSTESSGVTGPCPGSLVGTSLFIQCVADKLGTFVEQGDVVVDGVTRNIIIVAKFVASDWVDSSHAQRVHVTPDLSLVGDVAGAVPYYVSSSVIGSAQLDDVAVFDAKSGAPVPFEVDAGAAGIWLDAPRGADGWWIYFARAEGAAPQTSSSQWSSYSLVFHFGTALLGAGDNSVNGSTVFGGVTSAAPVVPLAGDAVQLAAPAVALTASGMTPAAGSISAWINTASDNRERIVAYSSAEPGGSGGQSDEAYVDLAAGDICGWAAGEPAGACDHQGTTAGTWHQIAATWDAADTVIYFDGERTSTFPRALPVTSDVDGVVAIGGPAVGLSLSDTRFYQDLLDEVRFAPTALTPEDIKVEFKSMVNPMGASRRFIESLRPVATFSGSGVTDIDGLVIDLSQSAAMQQLQGRPCGVVVFLAVADDDAFVAHGLRLAAGNWPAAVSSASGSVRLSTQAVNGICDTTETLQVRTSTATSAVVAWSISSFAVMSADKSVTSLGSGAGRLLTVPIGGVERGSELVVGVAGDPAPAALETGGDLLGGASAGGGVTLSAFSVPAEPSLGSVAVDVGAGTDGAITGWQVGP